MISAKPNTPIATLAKPMPSASSGTSKVMRPAPVSRSEPTMRQQQAGQDHRQRLEHRALGQHDGEDQAQHHQREIFGRPEQQREAGQRRAERRDQHGRRRSRRRTSRWRRWTSAGPARPCRAIWWPSSAGDHRRRLARNVDQDRRGRAAVLRAVIDAGEHDQRADRRQPEGDRQQHGDGGDRADAGQHADQRADQRTDQAEQQCSSGGRDREAQCKIGEKFGHGDLIPDSSYVTLTNFMSGPMMIQSA